MRLVPDPVNSLRVTIKAGQGRTRHINRSLILQYLIGGEQLSRADLARSSGLTAATVSNLVAELTAAGLVTEAGARRDDARVGKPPTILRIRPEARNVITVDLSSPTGMKAAVIDLAGNIISRIETPNCPCQGEVAILQIQSLVRRAIGRATAPILGIGIGTPGRVSPSGCIIEAAIFNWHKLPLARRLEEVLGYPVVVSNDANAAAVAEYTRGGHSVSNLAVIKIGSGIGAGFVLDGTVLQGEHSGAGEIGHLVVDDSGPTCLCGNSGCLQTFLETDRIQAALNHPDSDPTTVRKQAAEHLAVALAAVVAILDISNILISAPRDLFGDDFCTITARTTQQLCLHGPGKSVSVRYTSLNDTAVLVGAGVLVLRQELGVA